jgi:phage FluMu protein gp41
MSQTIKGTLKHGLKVGDEIHKDFEIREATTEDMFNAEDVAPVHKRLKYQGALVGQQLVKLGSLSGPIAFEIIRKLHPQDFDELVDAKEKANELGNVKPAK